MCTYLGQLRGSVTALPLCGCLQLGVLGLKLRYLVLERLHLRWVNAVVLQHRM